MFELLTADRRRTPHRAVPLLIATTAHVVAVGVLLVASLVYVKAELPEARHTIVFVASSLPPPPPPPAPPPPAASAARTSKAVVPVRAASRPAPVVAPATIATESAVLDVDSEDGVPEGIEGGVPGGVVGGVIGGVVPIDVPPPPPPPAPVAQRGPVRIGGAIIAPTLIERVEPEYPQVAVSARVQGVVILEATVGRDGRVEDVRVLSSPPLLDRAAMHAVRQWRYSPLLLNEKPERFVLTVTVSFSLGTYH